MPEFKIGDRVKVVRNADPDTYLDITGVTGILVAASQAGMWWLSIDPDTDADDLLVFTSELEVLSNA